MDQNATSQAIHSRPWRPPRAAVPVATRLGTALVIAALGTAPTAAQDERMVGIWQKDTERSDAPWPGRHDRPQPNPADIEIEISLIGEDVEIVQTRRQRDWPTPRVLNVNYITNSKPNPAPDLRGGGMREVRAKWRKKKLTVSYTVKFPWGGEADVQEIWEIPKKGTYLLHTIFGRGEEGRPDIRKNYYVRATTVQ